MTNPFSGLITKVQLARGTASLIDNLKKIPHGPIQVMVGSAVFFFLQFLNNYGQYFGPYQPYIGVAIAILHGVQQLAAVNYPGSGNTLSDWGALGQTILTILAQTLIQTFSAFQLLPGVSPDEYKGFSQFVQFVQAFLAQMNVGKSRETGS